MPLILYVAIPTLVCSILSLTASSTFAVLYLLYPPERHFRQALIVNLLVADWINSLNNTVSGIFALSRHLDKEPIPPGPACTANGYIGQFSVQAIDFNILVISISVLLSIKQSRLMVTPPWWQIGVMCAIPWIPPLFTSNIALGLHAYGPVSGNWCWIEKKYLALRYALTHGFRMAIFVTTIGIYTYVYIFLMQKYGKLTMGSSTTDSANRSNGTVLTDMSSKSSIKHVAIRSSVAFVHHYHDQVLLEPSIDEDDEPHVPRPIPPRSTSLEYQNIVKEQREQQQNSRSHPSAAARIAARERKAAVRKMLLLNGYPICYIVLWIPGIANRLAEIAGKPPTWLTAMQASTQLVGLANALTYAYSERLKSSLWGK